MTETLKAKTEKTRGTHLTACPGCGAFYDPAKLDPAKTAVCKNCGVDLSLTPEEAAKQRLSDSELAEKLASLNKKAGITKKLAIGGACAVAAATAFESFTLGMAGFIAACVFGIMYASLFVSAKTLLANNITRDIMAEVFDECIYTALGRLPDETLCEAGVIWGWDTASGSDLVTAKYKGHTVNFSDIELCEKVESEDDHGNTKTQYALRFKGQWLVCELGREVPAKLRLRENIERTGKLSRKLFGGRIESKDDVKTENEAFNKRFQILTEDPHSAFYILTPHFMEFIMNADDAADTRTYLSFLENRVHILAYNRKDSFELKKGDGANLEQIRQRMRGDLNYITSILDELLRNEYLFGNTNGEGMHES